MLLLCFWRRAARVPSWAMFALRKRDDYFLLFFKKVYLVEVHFKFGELSFAYQNIIFHECQIFYMFVGRFCEGQYKTKEAQILPMRDLRFLFSSI